MKAPAQHLARRFGVARGFEGVLGSDVPVASGLSSSAALVCAVGLALARLAEVDEREIGHCERGFGQIHAAQNRAGQIRERELRPAQVEPGKVTFA